MVRLCTHRRYIHQYIAIYLYKKKKKDDKKLRVTVDYFTRLQCGGLATRARWEKGSAGPLPLLFFLPPTLRDASALERRALPRPGGSSATQDFKKQKHWRTAVIYPANPDIQKKTKKNQPKMDVMLYKKRVLRY